MLNGWQGNPAQRMSCAGNVGHRHGMDVAVRLSPKLAA